jgi:hypothetical protein
MEPFSIILNQTEEKGSKFKRFAALLSLIFVVTGVTIYFLSHIISPTLLYIFLALYLLQLIYFFYLLFAGSRAKIFISGDDYALEYQFSMMRKVPDQVIWETLKKVRLGPTYISFIKRSGKKKVIPLGWLPYAKVVEIKDKVHVICTSKGIDVEVAEYHVG